MQKQKCYLFLHMEMSSVLNQALTHLSGLQTEYFTLCSEHFEASCFSRSVRIRTPVDFKRFCLEQCSVPSIYTKPKDSLDIDYSRNEGRLANWFFPKKRALAVSLGPYRDPEFLSPPPKKKNWFLFGLGRPNRDMLSIFRDDRSTTLPTRMGQF